MGDDEGGAPGEATTLPSPSPPPPSPSGGRSVRDVAVAAGLLATAIVVPLLRVVGTRSWEGLFAEDGTVYYQQLRTEGPLGLLLRAFNGYAQVPTRLLAAPSALVPIDHVPVYFAVVGATVAALVAAATFHLSRAWIPHPALRLALCALMVLTPVARVEVNANLVNLIWTYLAALPFALASLEERRRDVVVRSVVVLAAATSTVVAFVFVPLALAFVAWRRTRAALGVGIAYAVGLAVQGLVMLRAAPVPALPPVRDGADLLRLTGARVFAAPAFGEEAATSLWRDHGGRFLLVATVLVVGALVLVGIGADRQGRVVGAVLVAHSLAVFAVLALGRGTNIFRITGSLEAFAQARYTYVPHLLLFGAFAAMAASRRQPTSVASRVIPILLVAHVASWS